MTDSISVLVPGWRATDANDEPISGAKLKFYDAGTSTPKQVYSDYNLTVSLGTTVTCDSAGYPTSDGSTRVIIYTGTAAYKVVCTTAADAIVWSHDNVRGASVIPAADSAALPETPVVAEASNYTVLSADQGKLFRGLCTASSVAFTLPSAVDVGDGWRVGFQHAGTANVVTVTGTQSIARPNSSSSLSLALRSYGQTVWLVSDGATWTVDQATEPGVLGTIPFVVVQDRTITPPASPTGGDFYIISSTPTGVWLTSGYTQGQLVQADGNGGWIAVTPGRGWLAHVYDEDTLYQYRSGGWTALSNVTSPTSSNLKYAIFEHRESNGTDGGAGTDGAWTTRTLTHQSVNTITGMSLAGSGVINAPVGKFLVIAHQRFDSGAITAGVNSPKEVRANFSAGTATLAATPLAGLPGHFSGTWSGAGLTVDAVAGHTTSDTYLIDVTTAGTVALQYYKNGGTLGKASAEPGAAAEVYARVTVLDLASLQGEAGPMGSAGTDGIDAGHPYVWGSTVGGAPGSGVIRGNHGTIASITALHISETDVNGVNVAADIATWDDSTSALRATISITKEGAGGAANKHLFAINGAATDMGTYRIVPVTYLSTAGTISNGDSVAVLAIAKGDKGDTGATGASGTNVFTYTFDPASIADSDPGSGKLRANNANLSSATQLFISETDFVAINQAAALAQLDDSTNTHKGYLTLVDQATPANKVRFSILGTVTDAGSYNKVTVAYVSGVTSLTATTISVLFERTGDQGSGPPHNIFYAHDYATLADALTAAAGNTLIINPGMAYSQSSGVTIPADTKVIAYGASLTLTAQATAVDMSAANTELRGLTITGPGQGAGITSGIGIYIAGTINGAATAPTYTTGQKIIDVTISGFDGYAGYILAATDVDIVAPKISDIRYAGFLCLSVQRVTGSGAGYILGPFSGSASNAYGITFTRNSGSTDYVRYPRSEDCTVTGWVAEKIELWAAFDTHAGKNIKFVGCTAIDCRLAYNFSSDALQLGPENCWAIGCNAEIDPSSSAYDALYAGVIAGVSATYPAKNCGFVGGTWKGCGLDLATAGALYIVYSIGTRVSDMVFDTPIGAAIQVDIANIGCAISDITVIDPTGTTTVEPPCVRVENGGSGSSSTVRIDNLTAIATSATTGFTYKNAYLVSVNGSYNVVRMGVFQKIGTWTGTSAGTVTSTAIESDSPTITSPTLSGYKSVLPGSAVVYTPETIATSAGLVLFGWRMDGIDRAVDANETNYYFGADVQMTQLDIGSGFTDSGGRAALRFSQAINDTNFQGTLTNMYGVQSVVGILGAGASGARTITNVYGYYMDMRDSAGTISNPWGLYQLGANFINRLESSLRARAATATPAGGSVAAFTMGSSLVGIYWGSGAPTVSAPKGSLYTRTDGSSTSTRLYINTDGSTGWTNITTAT